MRLPTSAEVALLAGIGVVGVLAATRPSALLIVGAAAAAALLLLNAEWALIVFAASIPFQELLVLGGPVGTLTRISGLIFAAAYIARTRGKIHPRTLPLAAWIFVLWAIASATWSGTGSITQPVSLIQLFILGLLAADFVSNAGDSLARRTLWGFTAGAALSGALALARFNPSGLSFGYQRELAFGGQGLAEFGTYTMVALIFAMVLALNIEWEPVRTRIAAIALVPLLVASLLVSGTRSAWAGTAMAFVLMAVYMLRNRDVRHLVLAVVGVSLTILIASISLPGLWESTTFRAATATTAGSAPRVEIWKVGFAVAKENPVKGVGYGRFADQFETDAALSVLQGSTIAQSGGRVPHSIYVGVVVELGIIGMVLFGILAIGLFVPGIDRVPKYLTIIVAALLVQGVFLDVLGSELFWLTIGLLAGSRYARQQATPLSDTSRFESKRFSLFA